MHCRSGDSVVVTARSAHGVRTTVRELQNEMDAGISVKGAISHVLLPMCRACNTTADDSMAFSYSYRAIACGQSVNRFCLTPACVCRLQALTWT